MTPSLQVVLRCLHRNICLLPPSQQGHWVGCWGALVSQVQAVVVQVYGNPLHMEESFGLQAH